MDTHNPIRILCVEDDDYIRLNAVEALKDAGFEVLEAPNSDRAMALFHNPDAVDVLFTDVSMPGKCDGVDLAEHVRAEHPGLPVVVTSGYSLDLTDRLGRFASPIVFISKPYSLLEIVQTMERLTEQPS